MTLYQANKNKRGLNFYAEYDLKKLSKNDIFDTYKN